ncbi:MAG: aldose 1-epimerase family protein [Acidobacteria bacterium]|nr:aldose 1-epimerase family protein [Acidobacteriota bacterium]
MSKQGAKEALLTRVGKLSQVGGITSLVNAEGRGKGIATLRVRTAAGLELWIVPDKGMDIYEASFLGQSLCWHSPTGLVHPSYYSSRGLDWLETFAGGLLTTCGLTTVGSPSIDDGRELGLHGSISNTSAEHVSWDETWDNDDCRFEIRGRARETAVHGANLLLERTISTTLRSKAFTIEDRVENQGVRESPLMVLYHFNFGYPLLTENSRIFASPSKVNPIDGLSQESLDNWMMFEAPVRNQKERVYFHEMKRKTNGWATVVLVRDRNRPDFGIRLSYDATTLPEFVQWKMTGENHFVLGLEPGNCRTLGRSAERQRGTLQTIQPGEVRRFQIALEILDSAQAVQAAIEDTIVP